MIYYEALIIFFVALTLGLAQDAQDYELARDYLQSRYPDEVKGGVIGRDGLGDELLDSIRRRIGRNSDQQDNSPNVEELLNMIQTAVGKLRLQLDELVHKVREPIEIAAHDIQDAMRHPQDALFALLEPKIECGDEKLEDPCLKMNKYCAIKNLLPICRQNKTCKCVPKPT